MSLSLSSMILGLIGFISLFLVTTGFDCLNFDSNMGATFDLSDLHRKPDQPPYTVIDGDLPCTEKVEQNYTYIFNICGAVTGGVPVQCRNVVGASTAGALQINTRGTYDIYDDYCYRVGEYSDSSTKLALLDQEDPTKGISLTYYGDYCSGQVQRKFHLQLQCSDRMSPVPTHALEYEHCVYTVTMPSIYGCPLECPVSNRKVCSGNGHCAYDDDKMKARCFCSNGYEGDDCGDKEDTSISLNYSPALLGLIITLFIIVFLLVGGIVFMAKQITAYREDLAHYEVLKGSDEEVVV